MLILTRKVGETLRIGNDISVSVLGIKGNQVRIGIDAPKDVSVHREEIFTRIVKEQEGPKVEVDGKRVPNRPVLSLAGRRNTETNGNK